jgi:hypothetical protein
LHRSVTQRVWLRIGWLFIGPEGLRAGWPFLLFALGIILGVRLVEEPLSQFLAQRLAIDLNELSAPAMLIPNRPVRQRISGDGNRGHGRTATTR